MLKHVIFTFLPITLFFFSPVLFSNKSLFYYDMLSARLPSMIFFKNEVLSGRLPSWNPYLYAGLPHLADPTNNVLSPFNIFYLLSSPIAAINIITALAFFLSGLGMYFFARTLGLRKIASLFTGLAFMFCGSSLILINDINSFLAVCFIPWIFVCFTKWCQIKKQPWFLLVVLAAAFQFFSGHPQYVYWTWIFLGLFLLFYFPGKISPNPSLLKRGISPFIKGGLRGIFRKLFIVIKDKFEICLKMGLAAIAFIGLSAIQLLPFLELMKNSFRPSNIEFAKNSQFQLIQLPRLFLVNFYGQLKTGTSWGPGSLLETGLGGIDGYIGFLSLAFLGLGLLRLIFKYFGINSKKDSISRCYIGIQNDKKAPLFFLAFLALILSFAPQLPLYNLLRILPFFKFFRSFARVLIFWSFFAILAAGYVFDELLKRGNFNKKGSGAIYRPLNFWRHKWRHYNFIGKDPRGILILLLITPLFIWQKDWFIKIGLKSFISIYQFIKHKPLDSFVYSQEKLKIILSLWHENLIIVLLGLVTLFVFLFKRNFWPLIFIFLIFEGFWFGKSEFLTVPREFMSPNPKITNFLQEKSKFNRVVSTGEIVPFTGLQSYWSHLRSRPPFSKNDIKPNELKDFPRFKKEVNMLPVNLTENYKLFNPSGYTAVVLKNYAQFWDSEVANSVTISEINDERLDLLGTKYFIAGYPDDFIKESYENLELVLEFRNLSFWNPTESRVIESNLPGMQAGASVKIYENKNAYPRAFLIDENEKFLKQAKIISYLPSKVEIEVETETPAKLVLTDSFYPGWQARIDGEKIEIKPFKNAFRLAFIPAGRHTVEFIYTPKSFILGGIISAGTLIVLFKFLKVKKGGKT